MLSSIWVATITGLPAARQARVSRFWIGGTEVHRQLDPEVAAGDHDAVRGLEDLGEGVDRRRLLDLGEDRGAAVGELARLEDVGRRAARRRAPASRRRGSQANSRSLRSLGDSAASGSTTSGTLTPLRLEISPPTTTSVTACSGEHSMHLQADLAVVDEEGRAGLRAPRRSPDAAGRPGSRRRRPGRGRSGSARPRSSITGPAAKVPHAQLRPLQVGEDADRPPDLGLDLANQRVPPGDVVVGAVAHVEAEDVGPGDEQARGSSRRCRRPGRGWRRS